MRYSREHKLETHTRIVKKASVRLREKGAHGIGVADLMKDAGLTHGGFYAHFDSREALVIEAFSYAMDRSTERWRKLAEATPPEKRLAAIVEAYLTSLHRDDPGHGCAVPTLGPEIARESPKTRKAFAAKLEQMIEMLADQVPELPRKAARKQATAAIATMIGTLVLARIAGSGEFSDEILAPGVTPRWIARRRPSRPQRNPVRGRIRPAISRPVEQRAFALHGLVDVIGDRADPRQVLAVGMHQQPEAARDRDFVRQDRAQFGMCRRHEVRQHRDAEPGDGGVELRDQVGAAEFRRRSLEKPAAGSRVPA